MGLRLLDHSKTTDVLQITLSWQTQAEKDALIINQNQTALFRVTFLDAFVSTIVPWLNFVSWIFYLMSFRKSAPRLELLRQSLERFGLRQNEVKIQTMAIKNGNPLTLLEDERMEYLPRSTVSILFAKTELGWKVYTNRMDRYATIGNLTYMWCNLSKLHFFKSFSSDENTTRLWQLK